MANLSTGQNEAIKLLLDIPFGVELDLSNEGEQLIWLGMGWLIGKGWAVYSGDNCFMLTEHGRKNAKSWLEE